MRNGSVRPAALGLIKYLPILTFLLNAACFSLVDELRKLLFPEANLYRFVHNNKGLW